MLLRDLHHLALKTLRDPGACACCHGSAFRLLAELYKLPIHGENPGDAEAPG